MEQMTRRQKRPSPPTPAIATTMARHLWSWCSGSRTGGCRRGAARCGQSVAARCAQAFLAIQLLVDVGQSG